MESSILMMDQLEGDDTSHEVPYGCLSSKESAVRSGGRGESRRDLQG